MTRIERARREWGKTRELIIEYAEVVLKELALLGPRDKFIEIRYRRFLWRVGTWWRSADNAVVTRSEPHIFDIDIVSRSKDTDEATRVQLVCLEHPAEKVPDFNDVLEFLKWVTEDDEAVNPTSHGVESNSQFRSVVARLVAARDEGGKLTDYEILDQISEALGPECSICRRRHGPWVRHACE